LQYWISNARKRQWKKRQQKKPNRERKMRVLWTRKKKEKPMRKSFCRRRLRRDPVDEATTVTSRLSTQLEPRPLVRT
jgi:hypothetical protein